MKIRTRTTMQKDQERASALVGAVPPKRSRPRRCDDCGDVLDPQTAQGWEGLWFCPLCARESGGAKTIADREPLSDLKCSKAGLVLALFLLASPVAAQECEESGLFRVLGWTTYGVMAGDVVSTDLALSRGGYEMNPLQGNRFVRISSHVAFGLTMNYMSAKVYKSGRKKTALWMRIATVAAFGYATAHNLRS